LSSPNDWIKINAGQHVPLRVAYTPSMVEKLCVAIRSKAIPAMDRAGLILDSFALARASHIPPETVLQLLKSFETEHEQIVWDALEQVIKDLDRVFMHDQNIYGNFVVFMKEFIRPAYGIVGWDSKEGETDNEKLFRGCIISLCANYSQSETEIISAATERFADIFSNPKSHHVCADVIVPILKIVLKNGDEKEFNEAMDLFKAWQGSNIEQKYIYRAIGSIRSVNLKEKALEWAISGEIKLQDFFYPVFSVSSSNLDGGKLAWDFYKANFQKVKKMIQKAHPSLMDAMISYSAYGLCSEENLNDFEQFFADHDFPQNRRKIAQTIEGLKMNKRFFNIVQASTLSNTSFWQKL
jgi:puromycin-sensitive aminopeptidase